ncbi:hypothetical protein CY35_04G058600 [Sphagnum magellanicum]|nr:hypothetical protein CY35_04G058600 [Sphagnum magellanicum]
MLTEEIHRSLRCQPLQGFVVLESVLKMCGIALILSGFQIEGCLASSTGEPPTCECQDTAIGGPCIKEICDALIHRGPDSLGTVQIHAKQFLSQKGMVEVDKGINDSMDNTSSNGCDATMDFVGASLQLRGTYPISQPLQDSSGNLLIFNGEVFGGLEIRVGKNDAEVASQVLWFGRDAVGRRSLLLHRPSLSDPRFLLTSVAPTKNFLTVKGVHTEDPDFQYWEELPCGMYSIKLQAAATGRTKDPVEILVKGRVDFHEWEDPFLKELVAWDRSFINPGKSIQHPPHDLNLGHMDPVPTILGKLRQAVKKRTTDIRIDSKGVFFQLHASTNDLSHESAVESDLVTPVAVLFSGGLDSMILAALADEYIDPNYGIDLLNVSFEGASAPDRISAISGLIELQQLSPSRKWRLVEVDADLTAMERHRSHLLSLICPSSTYMDLNIGTALWLAAKGEGWAQGTPEGPNLEQKKVAFKSSARVLLVGAGADEQCGGYSRHRTKFRLGGWEALHEEMRIDMHRIWKRNLGRDDRCMADSGKEARFPFLDEDVVAALLGLPLWEIVDLQQPIGFGDKKILRQVAISLGLTGAASLPKRAIQFGSRIARESNKREFGSNRSANQASAGSAQLRELTLR